VGVAVVVVVVVVVAAGAADVVVVVAEACCAPAGLDARSSASAPAIKTAGVTPERAAFSLRTVGNAVFVIGCG
jgi:hypothetical protein